MATFNNLYDVCQVLVDLIANRTGVADIHVGPPLPSASSATEAVRVTMLWATPQASHRNDSFLTNADGSRTPPPLTLETYFLVTTYGTTTDDAIQAYNLLGMVMQLFQSQTALQLPLTLPGVTALGTGGLSVVQMPVAIEMLEKVFTPLQVSQRPWAIFEVGPVQLVSLRPPTGPSPLVRPGGVNLEPLEVRTRPNITRITPSRVATGGRVRIDAEHLGAIDRVSIGRSGLTGAALVPLDPLGPIAVTLPAAGPNAVPTGTYDATASTGTLASEGYPLTVQAPTIPSVDAPATLQHSVAGALVLTGVALGAVVELFAWPDEGLTSPSDVHQFPVAATATSVTVSAGALAAANLRPVRYRLSARHAPHLFTPYVLLEFVP